MRFVLVDRFLEVEPGRRAVALKTFSPEEDYLRDHFPGFPVVPGTLLTEAMGQTGGWALAASLGFSRWPLLTMVQSAKFRRLVRPGEPVTLRAELSPRSADDVEVRATASVGEERAAEARLLLHVFDLDLTPSEAAGLAAWARATYASLGGTLGEGAGA